MVTTRLRKAIQKIRSSRFAHDPCFGSEVADGGELIANPGNKKAKIPPGELAKS
jgi:hypothetical protein